MPAESQEESKTAEHRQRKARASPWTRRVALGLGIAAVLFAVWRVGFAVRNVLAVNVVAPIASGKVLGHASLRHAKRFTIEYRDGCKLIRVANSTGAVVKGAVYQLVPRGYRPAVVEQGALLVETPVRRVIALSTTYAPTFLQLGVPEVLVGMAGVKMLNAREFVDRAERGKLVEVGDGTTSITKQLDLERIRTLAPDLILTSFLTDEGSKLQESGFKVAENSQWLEATPLGRAEWLKFVAAFLDREVEAESVFSGIEERYRAQAARAGTVTRRPTVMSGSDYRGTWFVPGGRSYVAAFIQDAGGDYLWKSNTSTESLPLKMEAVLERASNAEFWLLHMNAIRSRKELSGLDPRSVLFSAYRAGNVFNNDARLSPRGGNDYWESGAANPDRVLADLIAILHPELAPNHQFIWYRRLPEEVAP